MTSANTLLKNILDVKGAVVQGADFSAIRNKWLKTVLSQNLSRFRDSAKSG